MILHIETARLLKKDIILMLKARGAPSKYDVVDIGGALGPWAEEVVNCYIDIHSKEDAKANDPDTFTDNVANATWVQFDISNRMTWPLCSKLTPKCFNYSICTQTLEHSLHPEVAVKLIETVSKRGFISVPSVYTELRRGVSMGDEGLSRCKVSRHWRGFAPHRWLITVTNGLKLVFWPKLPFLEYMDDLDEMIEGKNLSNVELQIEWENEIPIYVVSDRVLDHPDPEKAINFYRENLLKDILG